MKRFSPWVFILLLVGSWPARAEEADDHYLRVLKLIEQAESFNTNSQAGLALAKFQQAWRELQGLQKTYPAWNVKMVSHRSKYLAERVAALSAPPAPRDETTNPETRPDSKGAGANSAALVKLLDPGAEPRKVLRLHPKPGDKQTLVLTMKVAKDTKLGEIQTPAIKLPVMTLTLDAIVKAVSTEGDITYETLISDAGIAEEPDVLPQVVELVKASLGSVKGLSGTGTTSNRGLNKGTDVKVPAGAAPQTREAMGQIKDAFAQMTLPLPAEAIGPGAKWEVKMPLESQGMKINQAATYELVSVEGERVTIKSTTVQGAANQKIQSPAMPGLKLDLTKMTGQGTGETTLDLGQLMPSVATVDFHSETSSVTNAGGQKQPMTEKTDLNVRVEAK